MKKQEAIEIMKSYFKDVRFVDHTLKVLSHGEEICNGENMDDLFINSIVTLGCIFHDIGIPEAVRKYSSMESEYQEKEGPAVARKLMTEIGIRPDITERVCYIVGNHHTQEKVDGIDFQIIWEADFLVNVQEGNITLKKDEVQQAIDENLKTATGKTLFDRCCGDRAFS